MYVALAQDPQSLNPLVAGDVWSVRALTPLYPKLYEAQSDLSVAPDLAAGPPAISADGLTWTVTLRPASWSDGKPITADDVVFTVQAEMNPGLDTRTRFAWAPLASVEAAGPREVRFHLRTPDAGFLGNGLVMSVVPRHALDGVALADMSGALFSTQPQVAGGPFRLQLRTLGQSLDLARNQRYYGREPYLDDVQLQVLADGAQLPDKLGQGYIDWAPDISAATAAALAGLPNVSVRRFPELGRFALQFNTRPGRPFAAAASRLAAAAALDHRKIAAAAGGDPVWSGVNALSWAYGAEADGPRSTSPAASGVASANLLYPLGDAPRAAAAREIARELAAGGTSITLLPLPPGDFQARLASGDFDLALAGLGEGVDPDPAAAVASWETPAQDPQGQNFGAYSDPAVDKLVREDLASSPLDRAGRRAILDQLQAELRADPPLVDLWTVDEIDAFSGNVIGVGRAGPQLDQDLQSSFYARWSLSA